VTVTPGDSTDNIVEVLMTQHRRIEQLINGLQDADPGSRPRLFGELTHALGIHESVEHVVVHPRVRQGVDGAADLIEKLMSDELSINDALVELGDVAPILMNSTDISPTSGIWFSNTTVTRRMTNSRC
jgi:hypothetical protein